MFPTSQDIRCHGRPFLSRPFPVCQSCASSGYSMFLYPVHLSVSRYHISPGPRPGRISRVDDSRSLPSTVADSDPTSSTARLISGAPGAGQAGISIGVSRSGQVRTFSLISYNSYSHVHTTFMGARFLLRSKRWASQSLRHDHVGPAFHTERGSLSPLPFGTQCLRSAKPMFHAKLRDQVSLTFQV